MSNVVITSALAALFVASLGAQASQTPTAQTPTPSSSASQGATASSGTVTVQGCVQPSVNAVSATPDAVGTAGSVSTATAFILTSAEKATGTSGSSASSSSPVASTYQLSAEDSKLIPHVGHKVEISGTVTSSDKPSSTAAASAGGSAPSPTLKVENVKMIAETCTP